MDGWSIILTFTNPQDAYMARAYLDSEGIETMIQDELTAQSSLYSNAIGGVKLWVRNEDYKRGEEVLKTGGYILMPKESKEEESWEWVKKTADNKHCPFCHSENIARKKDLDFIAVVLYFVLGVFFPIFRPIWQCFNCGKAWKYKN